MLSVAKHMVASARGIVVKLQTDVQSKGPFTHAIFDAISDAISRKKRSLPYPARMLFSRSIAWIGKKVITYYLKTPFFQSSASLGILSQRYAIKNPCGVGWGRFCAQNRIKIASKIACVNGP